MFKWLFMAIFLVNVVSCGADNQFLLQEGLYEVVGVHIQNDWEANRQGDVFENSCDVTINSNIYNMKCNNLDVDGIEQKDKIIFTILEGGMDNNCPMIQIFTMQIIPNSIGNAFIGWILTRTDFGSSGPNVCKSLSLYECQTLEGIKVKD